MASRHSLTAQLGTDLHCLFFLFFASFCFFLAQIYKRALFSVWSLSSSSWRPNCDKGRWTLRAPKPVLGTSSHGLHPEALLWGIPFAYEAECRWQYRGISCHVLASGMERGVVWGLLVSFTSGVKPPDGPRWIAILWIAKNWLQPKARSTTEVVERVAMDKFLRGLPDDVRWSVGMPESRSPLTSLCPPSLTIPRLCDPKNRC